MKAITGLSLAISLHAGLGNSLLVLPGIFRGDALVQLRDRLNLPELKIQTPPFMSPLVPSPGGDGGGSGGSGGGNGGGGDDRVISDVVGAQRSINIFAGLMRDVDPVYKRISDAGCNSTILAPTNAAMNRLPRKPWEDAADYNALGTEAYQGAAGENRAEGNLRRFVEAHIVAQSPWKEKDKATTVSGGEVWWEKKDGRKVIQPGEIEVTSETATSNGEIWTIERALAP